jgi:hypothetical protein
MTLVRNITIILIFLIGFSILLYSSNQTGQNNLTSERATQLVLENAVQTLPGNSFTVLSVQKSNESGKWDVQLKAVKSDPTCPNVLIRSYTVPPFDNYRDEKRVVNCKVSGNLVYEEEAIIASKENADVKNAISQGATSQAVKITQSSYPVQSKCSNCFYAQFLNGLISKNAALKTKTFFIVEWKSDYSVVLVALDEQGKFIGK